MDTVISSETKSQILEPLKNQIEHISKWGNIFGKSSKVDITFNSITDIVKQVKLGTLINYATLGVETGFMLYSLSTTYDEIKKSEQFRESPRLQQATAKIKEHLDNAEKFYRAADTKFNELKMTVDIDINENQLNNIALKLGNAHLECERAQQVLKNILNDIHQTMETLSSTKTIHRNSFIKSSCRLIMTAVDLLPKSIYDLPLISKVLYVISVSFETANTAGHGIGFLWTRNEIHKLEEHQHKLDTIEMRMKDLFDEIGYGMKKLEKIKQYMENFV